MRSVREPTLSGGYRVESWSLGCLVTAFDAELSALVRAIEIYAVDASEGVAFRIFSDSQAAIRRLMDDRPGPRQSLARRGIRIAQEGIYARGEELYVSWTPGHVGAPRNEIADSWAVDMAKRTEMLEKNRRERVGATMGTGRRAIGEEVPASPAWPSLGCRAGREQMLNGGRR